MKLELKGRQIAIFAALVVAVIMLFLPGRDRNRYSFSPDALAKSIASKSDHVQPRDLSQWIIEGRNDFTLVDIRTPEEYRAGHIRTARNIPLDRLLKRSTIDSEFNDGKQVVLYSNGSTHAAQAWLVLNAAGVNASMLEGGFNYWNEAILNPAAPAGQSDDEILRYKAAKAEADFHGGGTKAGEPAAEPKGGQQKSPVKPPAGKKKLQGC